MMHWPTAAVRATHCGSDLAGLELSLIRMASLGSTHPQTGRDRWTNVSALAVLFNKTATAAIHHTVHSKRAERGQQRGERGSFETNAIVGDCLLPNSSA